MLTLLALFILDIAGSTYTTFKREREPASSQKKITEMDECVVLGWGLRPCETAPSGDIFQVSPNKNTRRLSLRPGTHANAYSQEVQKHREQNGSKSNHT